MKLAILKVILWPKDPSHAPRVVPFLPGKINVLTGESASGKSSITWIIDYCLGSDKCSIPVGLIRDVTGWFGLHLQLPNTEMIVARRNPGDQQATSDIYWNEGIDLQVPPSVSRNGRVDDLKHRLNQLANLPYLDFAVDENVGFGGRPSLRDMAAFNFQPQHIVANPYTFFFKADTTEHREKLKIVFPLALGAIDADALAKQRELRDLEREHESLRRELDGRARAASAWENEVGSYYLQARALGLLPGSPAPDAAWPLSRFVDTLRTVPKEVRKLDLPDIAAGTAEASATDLARLLEEEDKTAQELGAIRRRLAKVEQLSSAVDEYGTTLVSQKDRLQAVGWFEEQTKDLHECPVCLAVHTEPNPGLTELHQLARELQTLTTSVQRAPAKLDHELLDLRKQARELESTLSKTRQQRKFLEDESAAMAAQRQRIREVYLFVGRVEQALENVANAQDVGDLGSRVKVLAEKISALRASLDPKRQRARLDAAIDSVSAKITDYANHLKLEHAAESVHLNIKELTLQFSPLSGRTDFLWEVGSGQNWVGYHVAGLLGLHEHFSNVPQNVVPRFLVVDQPSQVYFPEAWPSLDDVPSGTSKIGRSADIEGVHRIFEALSRFMDKVACRFQIIVTEHAGEITWAGLSHIHVVGNWRMGNDEFLIPAAWQTQSARGA